MNRGTLTRLGRLERQNGTAELWLHLGDGLVRHARTGIAVPEDALQDQAPAGFIFTFNIERTEPSLDAQ